MKKEAIAVPFKSQYLDSCNDEKRRRDCSAFEKTFCINT